MADIHDLAEQIKALTPADRLRMAADLIEKKRLDLAHMIAEPVIIELGGLLAMRALVNRREAEHQRPEQEKKT